MNFVDQRDTQNRFKIHLKIIFNYHQFSWRLSIFVPDLTTFLQDMSQFGSFSVQLFWNNFKRTNIFVHLKNYFEENQTPKRHQTSDIRHRHQKYMIRKCDLWFTCRTSWTYYVELDSAGLRSCHVRSASFAVRSHQLSRRIDEAPDYSVVPTLQLRASGMPAMQRAVAFFKDKGGNFEPKTRPALDWLLL